MAEHINKKARYEITEDEMKSLHENQPYPPQQQEEGERTRRTNRYSSSMNFVHSLRLRELCGNIKMPNIFRDYHLQAFHFSTGNLQITNLVIAGDIVLVRYISDSMEKYLVPFRLDGEMSPLTRKRGLPIIIKINDVYDIVFYNSYNNSVIVAVATSVLLRCLVSLDIASIKAGHIGQRRELSKPASDVLWQFDLLNCRGMIHYVKEGLFKFLELKKYKELFTIPDESRNNLGLRVEFRFGSPGNTEMLIMYENINREERKEVLLKIYSKETGHLRKEISVPVPPVHSVDIVELCGPERIVLHQSDVGMKIVDISSDISKIVKTTGIHLAVQPCYLPKRNAVMCYSQSRSLHLFNLQGEILVTFDDHPMFFYNHYNLFSLFKRDHFKGSYYTRAEDIVISACSYGEHVNCVITINISSIVTGKCLGKITSDAPNYSEIRKVGLQHLLLDAFAYDERSGQIVTGDSKGNLIIWSNKFNHDVRNGSRFDFHDYNENEDYEEA